MAGRTGHNNKKEEIEEEETDTVPLANVPDQDQKAEIAKVEAIGVDKIAAMISNLKEINKINIPLSSVTMIMVAIIQTTLKISPQIINKINQEINKVRIITLIRTSISAEINKEL